MTTSKLFLPLCAARFLFFFGTPGVVWAVFFLIAQQQSTADFSGIAVCFGLATGGFFLFAYALSAWINWCYQKAAGFTRARRNWYLIPGTALILRPFLYWRYGGATRFWLLLHCLCPMLIVSLAWHNRAACGGVPTAGAIGLCFLLWLFATVAVDWNLLTERRIPVAVAAVCGGILAAGFPVAVAILYHNAAATVRRQYEALAGSPSDAAPLPAVRFHDAEAFASDRPLPEALEALNRARNPILHPPEAALQEWLHANADYFALLDRAAAQPPTGNDSSADGASRPNVRLRRALQWQGLRQLATPDQAAAIWLDSVTLVRAAGASSDIAGYLYAVGLEELRLRQLRQLLLSPEPLSPAIRRRIIGQLAEQEEFLCRLVSAAFTAEKANLQRMLHVVIPSDRRLMLDDLLPPGFSEWLKYRTLLSSSELADMTIAVLQRQSGAAGLAELARHMETLSWLDTLTRMQAPALFQVLPRQHFGTVAKLRCAAAAMAIELYRAEHDRDPAEWSELIPEYLPTLPLDPLDGAALTTQRSTVTATFTDAAKPVMDEQPALPPARLNTTAQQLNQSYAVYPTVTRECDSLTVSGSATGNGRRPDFTILKLTPRQ